MKTTAALLLLILLEVVVLVVMVGFGQPLFISLVISLLVVVAVALFLTSDYFQDSWERWREQDRHG